MPPIAPCSTSGRGFVPNDRSAFSNDGPQAWVNAGIFEDSGPIHPSAPRSNEHGAARSPAGARQTVPVSESTPATRDGGTESHMLPDGQGAEPQCTDSRYWLAG